MHQAGIRVTPWVTGANLELMHVPPSAARGRPDSSETTDAYRHQADPGDARRGGLDCQAPGHRGIPTSTLRGNRAPGRALTRAVVSWSLCQDAMRPRSDRWRGP